MPSLNGIPLPRIVIEQDGAFDCDQIAAKLADAKLPVEAMLEALIYFKRERERVEALAPIEQVLRGRIDAHYEKLSEDHRETLRTEVGMATYLDGPDKIELKDRDFTVENLTAEQLRISYKPDLKALQTILKPEEFERHVTRSKGKPRLTIRATKSDEYTELDF